MELDPYINIHTHRPENGPDTVSVTNRMLGEQEPCPAPPCSAGIHPWSLEHLDNDDTDRLLAELKTAPELSAIGEIGLDYTRPVDRLRQLSVFEKQLDIASARSLPIILHSVRAWDDMLAALGRHTVSGVVFHGFTGNEQQAQQLTRKGYYLSFGSRSLLSPKTAEALRSIPTDRLFFETDSTPVPIRDVYEKASEILGMPTGTLRHIIYNNYRKWKK